MHTRLRDVLFLDISLDCTVRTTLETVITHVKAVASGAVATAAAAAAAGSGSGGSSPVPPGLSTSLRLVRVAVENAALSSEQVSKFKFENVKILSACTLSACTCTANI